MRDDKPEEPVICLLMWALDDRSGSQDEAEQSAAFEESRRWALTHPQDSSFSLPKPVRIILVTARDTNTALKAFESHYRPLELKTPREPHLLWLNHDTFAWASKVREKFT